MRIGLIADTHNLLRPEALAALRGVDHLIHAGDIGDHISSNSSNVSLRFQWYAATTIRSRGPMTSPST